MVVDTVTSPRRTVRVAAARAVAVVGVLVWWIGLMGPIDLAVPIYAPPLFYDAYLIETGWGLLYTVLLGVPTIALVARPLSRPAPLQVLAVAASLAVMSVATSDLGHLVPAGIAVLLVAAVRLLAGGPVSPWRGAWCRPRRQDAVAVVLVGLAVVPAVLYAADMARATREDRYPVDITQLLNHWPAQGAWALAVVAVAALSVVLAQGRMAAWCASVSAVWLGVVSVLHPDHSGSIGAWGGWAAVVWGVALLLASEVSARGRRGPG